MSENSWDASCTFCGCNLVPRQLAYATKCDFAPLIDLARAQPVAVAKHGRPVVVVMAVEEFHRLMGFGTDDTEIDLDGDEKKD